MRSDPRVYVPALLVASLLSIAAVHADIPVMGDDRQQQSAVPGDAGETRFADSWFLVRLTRPLENSVAEGEFSLVTGHALLDAGIRENGVRGIVHALPVSMRNPRDPDALRRHGLDRTYRFRVPFGSDILFLVDRFSAIPGVVFAEPDYSITEAATIPNDPLFDDQWGLDNTGQTGGCPNADVDAPEAWDLSTGGPVVVAVLDSGCDFDHPDLQEKCDPGYNFVTPGTPPEDQSGHGTKVASVKVEFASEFADACAWAADHGARIINFSATFSSAGAIILGGVGYAYDAGVVLVAANGNGSAPAIGYPARYAETLALGFSRWCDERGPISNWGPENDVVAPGYFIPTAQMGGGYDTPSGTSLAAPHVSGLLGIMMTLNPSLGREEARHLIRSAAEDEVGDESEDTPGFDQYMGWGRVNAHETLKATNASMSLRVEGKTATRPYFETANDLADSYDFVRGSLSALTESAGGVELGTLVCLEDDSADPDTAGNEDTETPPPGEAFFYLGRFHAAPGAGSYGGSSRNRDRMAFVNGTGASWFAESDQVGALFGVSVYKAGDVNMDGYDDVIVGADGYDNDQVDEGRALVYHGSASGLESIPAWTVESDQSVSEFGWSVATAGDVNNDGYDDVIVGAQLYDGDLADEGAAYVYMGSPSGLATTPAWTAEGDQAGASFGFRVRTAGDVNNDGFDDVIVGAYLHDAAGGNPDNRPDRGRAYVYLGSESGLQAGPADWTFEPDQPYARAGVGVGTAGDIDMDGYDDVVVGAPLYDNGQINEGRLFVFYGSDTGLGSTPTELEIDVVDARLGYTVGTAGDVNNDGYDDIIAGAFRYSNGETGEGAVFVFLGSSSGIARMPAWSFESDQAEAELGISAESAGDTDGDGYDDIVVGAYLYDAHRTDNGHAWLFLGSPSGPEVTPAWTDFVHHSGAGYGNRLSSAGDVNGDDLDDVIVGSLQYDNGEFLEGRAYAYHGPLTESVATGCPD
jgi:hypothetical protein